MYFVIANLVDWQLRNLLGEEIWDFESHIPRDELQKKIIDRVSDGSPVLQKYPVIISINGNKLIVRLKSPWYIFLYFYMVCFYFRGELLANSDGTMIRGRCRYNTFIRIWFLIGYNVVLVVGLTLVFIALVSLIQGEYAVTASSLLMLLLLPLVVIGWYGIYYILFLRGAARARRKRLHDVIARLVG